MGSFSGWLYDSAPINIALLQQGIVAAQNAAAANAALLAQLIGQQNGDSSGGATISVDFTQMSAGSLGADWTVETLSGVEYTGIYQPASPPTGFENNQGISGKIAWFLAPIPGGFHAAETLYHRHNVPLETDSVEVTFTLNTYGGEGDAGLHAFSHADSALANFMRVTTRKGQYWWGPATYSAGTYSWSDWNTNGHTFNKGDTVSIRNQGTLWTLRQNGTIVDTFTDAGGDVFYDSLHRYWGFLLEIQNEIIALTDVCFGLSAITASDVAIPTYLGTGWRIHRANTGNTAGISSANTNQQMPANTYDTVALETNCTVQDLGRGEIVIPTSGRWTIVISCLTNNTIGGSQIRPVLGKRPSVGGALSWIAEGGGMTGGTANEAAAFTEYYNAGEVAIAGYASSSIGNAFKGEATGARMYFAGMLSNR